MVQHLDAQIGDLIALLDSLGQLDNTLVLFASDNGAHREGGHDRRDILNGNLAIELYDLSQDPAETEDIASAHPEVVARMKEIMAHEHETPFYEPWQMPAIE